MKIVLGIIFFVSQICSAYGPWSMVHSPQITRVQNFSPRSLVHSPQTSRVQSFSQWSMVHSPQSILINNGPWYIIDGPQSQLEQTASMTAVANHPVYGLSTMDYRLPLTAALHDYHISNFEIEYNAETKALEIIAKIFIDDLEDGIAASGVEEKLYLCTDREIESGDDHVYAYISDKMSIKVNGQEVSYNYIGKEVSEDLVAMFCYLEVENVESVEEITISNDMLIELFDDQINIVKLKSKSTGKRGFMMLKKGQQSDTVNWQ